MWSVKGIGWFGFGPRSAKRRVFNRGQLGYEAVMQTIFKTSLTPEQYVEQDYQKQVKPPENCPNCRRAHTLEALVRITSGM